MTMGEQRARALAMVALIVCACGAANAQQLPPRGVYLGAFTGGNLVLSEWDLHEQFDSRLSPGSGGLLGFRVGALVVPWLAIEAELGVLPYTAEGQGESGLALRYDGAVVFNLLEGAWVPTMTIGAGAYHGVSGPYGADIDYNAFYGVGVRGALLDWLALRVDVRHYLTDSWKGKGAVASNLEFTAGVDFLVWAETRTPDTDSDGLPDPDDRCPKRKGPEQSAGCPDSDRDGLVDPDDKCPMIPGTKALKGCPDQDGDGVTDRLDRCPTVAGAIRFSGCPDTDGDGIEDKGDQCPAKRGQAKFGGCPDSDGDGIEDRQDRCPAKKGLVEEQGCPVVPDEIKQRFSGTLEGIFFKSGSATIEEKSYAVLDDVAEALLKYGELRIRIEGHTDDRGDDDKNLKLSRQRAESVRAYLTTKGIEAGRLAPAGFGATRAVANNRSRAGRAKNRRIEFHIIEK